MNINITKIDCDPKFEMQRKIESKPNQLDFFLLKSGRIWCEFRCHAYNTFVIGYIYIIWTIKRIISIQVLI